jgi:hypothetical protein
MHSIYSLFFTVDELEVISTRQTLAKIILSLLKIPKRHEINEKGIFNVRGFVPFGFISYILYVALLGVLTGCKILMRNRQGIDVLLTSEVRAYLYMYHLILCCRIKNDIIIMSRPWICF